MKTNSIEISDIMDSFEKICKIKGLRITHQRTEIYKALAKHLDHPTTEDIFNRVRKRLKTISLDTVYRTISTFEDYGLIKKVYHVDSVTRFDINVSNHHHMICSRCNKIEDFYWPEFDHIKPPESVSHWARIEDKQVIINGLCSSCKEE